MRIRTSLLLLLSIIFNIILITTVNINFFYIFTLVILIISEGVLIYEIVQQIKNKDKNLIEKEKLNILKIILNLGYEIKFEGKPQRTINLYYNNEFIVSILYHQRKTNFYIINGLFKIYFESENQRAIIDSNTLIMRLCDFKENPEKYIKGDKTNELSYLME